MRAKKNNGSILLKLGLVLVVLGAIAAGLYFGLQRTARVQAVKRDTAVDAVTGSVHVDADGGIKELKSEAGGKVIWAEGIAQTHRFKKGDTLVKLDTKDLERQIDEAKRRYESNKARSKLELENNPEQRVAKELLDNALRLQKIGTVSEKEVDAAQRNYDAVVRRLQLIEFDQKKADDDHRIAMEDMEILREKMTIKAPFDGQIDTTLTWVGALIGQGQTVATAFSNDRVVAAKISEESFGKVKVGQTARLRLLTYGTQHFDATVSKLHPKADDAQRFTVFLDVKVEPDQLKPGSTGEVTITVDTVPNQIMIPRRALVDGDKVFVVKNGVVERRDVKVGYLALNVAQISEGLQDGEQIIVDRLEEFRDGQRVRVELLQ